MKADIQEVFKTLYTIPYDHIDFDLQSESLPGEKRFFYVHSWYAGSFYSISAFSEDFLL